MYDNKKMKKKIKTRSIQTGQVFRKCFWLFVSCNNLYIWLDLPVQQNMVLQCWGMLEKLPLPPHLPEFSCVLHVAVGILLLLLVTYAVSNRKRDVNYWIMFFHHLICVILISTSWCSQLHRIGCLILFIGDASDFLLALSKCLHYARKTIMCRVSLVTFTFTWIALRLGIYPFVLLPSFLLDYHHQFQSFPIFSMAKFLLSVIMLLIIIWTWMILKTFFLNIYLKVEAGDVRSDDEGEVIGETEMENTNITTTHGCAGPFKLLKESHKKLD